MYRAVISQTSEVLECECFKNLYNATMWLVKDYLERNDLHNAIIYVDGEEKYRLSPMVMFYDGENIGKVIHLIRLSDWNCIAIRSMDGTNQAAKRCLTRYLNKLSDPPEKEEIEGVINRIANRFTSKRKDFDKLVEELNKVCYNN